MKRTDCNGSHQLAFLPGKGGKWDFSVQWSMRARMCPTLAFESVDRFSQNFVRALCRFSQLQSHIFEYISFGNHNMVWGRCATCFWSPQMLYGNRLLEKYTTKFSCGICPRKRVSRYGTCTGKKSYSLPGDHTRKGHMDVDGRLISKWFL